ncbi:MAG: hypothetical protein JXB60_05710 [Candidatus Cloacimonetes bacterium]|nr:hypothetical protein [Candidatus Cloacimonadota bacterium]
MNTDAGKINTGYNKNFGKWFLTEVIHAIQKYRLISNGEKVCVALSGGKDSITLLYILFCVQKYSYFDFALEAAHIRMADYDTAILRHYCKQLEIAYHEKDLFFENNRSTTNNCYLCSRLRRSAIADLIRDTGAAKVAYGHHADDAAETFLMNMIQHRILGSFAPRVVFHQKPMILIRPLIYLDNSKINAIHKYAGLPVLNTECQSRRFNIRNQYREFLDHINQHFHIRNFSLRLVQALENIDWENLWDDRIKSDNK